MKASAVIIIILSVLVLLLVIGNLVQYTVYLKQKTASANREAEQMRIALRISREYEERRKVIISERDEQIENLEGKTVEEIYSIIGNIVSNNNELSNSLY